MRSDHLSLVVDALSRGVYELRVDGTTHEKGNVRTDRGSGEVRQPAVGAAEVHDVHAALSAVAGRGGVRQELRLIVRPDQDDAVLRMLLYGNIRRRSRLRAASHLFFFFFSNFLVD